MKTTSGLGVRSNRPLTEFACTHLGLFLTGYYDGLGERSKGNTSIQYEVKKDIQVLKVSLYDEEILEVKMSNWKACSVKVSFTSFYDDEGKPTTTTIERLNGLLDRLGSYRIIPEGIRVFRDPSQGVAYIGSGDNKIAVGKKYVTAVMITPIGIPTRQLAA
jgi:hypothetical protein